MPFGRHDEARPQRVPNCRSQHCGSCVERATVRTYGQSYSVVDDRRQLVVVPMREETRWFVLDISPEETKKHAVTGTPYPTTIVELDRGTGDFCGCCGCFAWCRPRGHGTSRAPYLADSERRTWPLYSVVGAVLYCLCVVCVVVLVLLVWSLNSDNKR